MNRGPDGGVRVWDVPVRVLHAALITGFFAAWFTRHATGAWHEWLGYVVLGILALRLIWGAVGSRYARFSQFVRGPAATLSYGASLVRGKSSRYLGHNPLGGWMIVALIVTVLATCISGWLYTTDRFWGIAWVGNLHLWLSNLALALVGLHVAGVLFGCWHDRENLVAAMIHGRKRAPQPGDIT